MSLVIHAGTYRAATLRQLAQLVPPEVWTMDNWGFISMPKPPEGIASPATLMLWALVRTPGLVEIAGTEGASTATVNGSTIQLRDIGGAAYFDPANQGESASVTVFYDTTNNYNVGYWTEGEGGKHIDMPSHILLAHELAHAIQVQEGTWIDKASGELYAIDRENAIRAASQPVLPGRTSHNGGPNTPPKSTTKPPSKKSGCFVATAAYGSTLDPAVEELRQFRDNVVRKTRYGCELHDRLLPTYRLASMPIIAAMNEVSEIREVVRDWVVRPLVHYLRLARDFPDLPVESAGPWAPFISRMRDDLAEFARVLPLPTRLHEVPADEAVEELIVALTFQLRTEEARLTWLRTLQQENELPLHIDEGQRAQLNCRLSETGRSSAEIACILGGAKPNRMGGSEGGGRIMATAFGNDIGTPVETVSWRYTVTIRNNMPTTSLYNLRVYYLAEPGGPTDMGVVLLPDLHPTEVGVFPLCECQRLKTWYLEADFVDDVGSGTLVWPEEGVVGPDSIHDGHPCEDSIVLEG
jgi:hypothetical protein